MKNLALLLLFALSSSLLWSQSRGVSKAYQVKQNNFIQLEDQNLRVNDFFSKQKNVLGISDGTEFILNKVVEGANGLRHHRFDQIYNGVPVLNTTYILHERNGIVVGANGSYLAQVNLDTKPSIDAEMAMNIAMMDMKAESYSWDHEGYEKPVPELVIIDQRYPSLSELHLLVYHVTLYSILPVEQKEYFIDAHSGHVLKKFDVLHEWAIPATAETKYYGTKDIITDSIAPEYYILKDETRGQGIRTLRWDVTNFVNESTHWVLTNEDQDEVALDAHWCAEKFYDLLFDDFSWYGLGNNGESLNSRIHYGNGLDVVNAFWDGTYAIFGDGDCLNGPLTTLEVVGHEFMHGVTDYTSNLIYQGESGAINESMSDVFGKALEHKEDFDNFSWYLGHSFLLVDSIDPFRSFEDPTEFNHPDYYKGQIWNDNAGVHTNSSVGNHWFWGLVEGETGVNEEGENYSINGIGWEKALQIVFSCETNYLVENSDYNAYYNASVLATEELYGVGAPEIDEVKQAWLAVGLPRENGGDGGGGGEFDIDLAIQSADPNFIISTCLDNEYYDVEFFITNNGPEIYVPSMGAVVELSVQNDDPIIMNLDMTLDVGETLTIVFDDAIFMDEIEDVWMYGDIVFLDNNANNNSDFVYVSNTTLQTPDLVIDVNNFDNECSSDEFWFALDIENIGCTLPAGSIFSFEVIDELGTEILSEEVELTNDWGQNFIRIYVYQTLVNVNNVSNFTLRVHTDEDLNDANNVVEFYMPKFDPITDLYLNEFETEDGLMQQIDVDLFNYGVDEWAGHYQFGTSSFFTQQGPLCPGGPDDIFDQSFALTTISFCADLTNLFDPRLSFDLTQYRNEAQEGFDDFPDLTTMLRLSWSGSHEFTEVIKGQTEGERVYSQYSMPQGFVGEVVLEFFHKSGTFISNPNFLDYDVSLLDNLEISARTTATNNPQADDIIIFPNPAEDLVYLKGLENAKAYRVFDSKGAEVMSRQRINSHRIEISIESLNEGFYYVELEFEDGNRLTKSFVRG